MFLRHEGYLGAIGAFLLGVEEEGDVGLYGREIICRFFLRFHIINSTNSMIYRIYRTSVIVYVYVQKIYYFTHF